MYRVNPILINWELHFKPEASGKPALEYDGVTYEPMELQPCEGIFRFASIRNAETGEITYYNR